MIATEGTQTHTTCQTCGAELHRSAAHLRSISLTQVAFCSLGCVDVFDRLDKAARSAVPVQREAVSA